MGLRCARQVASLGGGVSSLGLPPGGSLYRNMLADRAMAKESNSSSSMRGVTLAPLDENSSTMDAQVRELRQAPVGACYCHALWHAGMRPRRADAGWVLTCGGLPVGAARRARRVSCRVDGPHSAAHGQPAASGERGGCGRD